MLPSAFRYSAREGLAVEPSPVDGPAEDVDSEGFVSVEDMMVGCELLSHHRAANMKFCPRHRWPR